MISFERVSKQYGGTIVFEKATFIVNERERTGLVGPNGSGKTALPCMVNGEEYVISRSADRIKEKIIFESSLQ